MTKGRSARRAALSRERIVAAAAALVDREGAEALSARRLASELGCEAMSLYHHVPNMGGLLDAVVDDALGAIGLPEPDAADPERQLLRMTAAYLKLAATRPQRFRVLGARCWCARASSLEPRFAPRACCSSTSTAPASRSRAGRSRATRSRSTPRRPRCAAFCAIPRPPPSRRTCAMGSTRSWRRCCANAERLSVRYSNPLPNTASAGAAPQFAVADTAFEASST